MHRVKFSSWSLLLIVSCGVSGMAQQTFAIPPASDPQCVEYYGCVPSRPLSQVEARWPAPMGLSARQLPLTAS
jgi:hypothetical protein